MGNPYRPADRFQEQVNNMPEIQVEHQERVANLEAKRKEEFQEEVREEEQQEEEES